jgi:hypothetical protein
MATIVRQRPASTAPRWPLQDGLAGPAAVERNKRREYSRSFLDYGPSGGLYQSALMVIAAANPA